MRKVSKKKEEKEEINWEYNKNGLNRIKETSNIPLTKSKTKRRIHLSFKSQVLEQ
jgi:hypothetical protein